MIPVADIQAARTRGAGLVKVTPLDLSATFSTMCGRQIYLKLESLQKTGSFKVRGALNKIQALDPAVRARGVIAASAGNHAQGVAYAGRAAGAPVTVVMPETASFSKVNATIGYGAEVVLAGRDYRQAYEHAARIAQERQLTLIHAYDDPEVITGQGTIGLELLEQLPDVDTVLVPVGGGGLAAGIISALRGAGSPARIIGVQAAGAATLAASLRDGTPIQLAQVDTIADGLATGSLGTRSFAILRAGLDAAVEVNDAQIAAAILLLLERAKAVVEGAAAVGLAAALAGYLPPEAHKVVLVISGGNIDTNLLDRIINLGLVSEGRLFRFRTELPDRPGELQRLVACIGACGANIRHIQHERAEVGLAPTVAAVTLELETRGRAHVQDLECALAAAGFARRAAGN
jgi:threonine dehydratase